MAEDYLPREDDILRARKITQGMDQLTFKQNVSFIFQIQAFLDFRGFRFTAVYNSILFSSPLVLLSK